ncbi:hypothetical protein KNP414_00743 [Paenibacillus mucilaginosus KNP414]|uniref:Uncharacterized protein n=1 Tax=Paenibacillus mucilaginosus (strain KNP414) TaxID=1036673 RepID=F8FR83_PAEMK|nr:hypothetical protein KNP414_00743 [Paenibacillus mucilaginosus KNP414]
MHVLHPPSINLTFFVEPGGSAASFKSSIMLPVYISFRELPNVRGRLCFSTITIRSQFYCMSPWTYTPMTLGYNLDV